MKAHYMAEEIEQKRSDIHKQILASKAANLVITGMSYDDVATSLGLERPAEVHNLLEIHLAKNQDQQATAQARQIEVMRLDAMINSRWERAVDEQDDFAFDRLMKVLERRAKLMGLDKPNKTQIAGPDGGPVQLTVVEQARNMVQDMKLDDIIELNEELEAGDNE